MAGGEVIQPDDSLVEFEQGFEQVATNEACHSGDEPGVLFLQQFLTKLVV